MVFYALLTQSSMPFTLRFLIEQTEEGDRHPRPLSQPPPSLIAAQTREKVRSRPTHRLTCFRNNTTLAIVLQINSILVRTRCQYNATQIGNPADAWPFHEASTSWCAWVLGGLRWQPCSPVPRFAQSADSPGVRVVPVWRASWAPSARSCWRFCERSLDIPNVATTSIRSRFLVITMRRNALRTIA
jgi:hypothetical protein